MYDALEHAEDESPYECCGFFVNSGIKGSKDVYIRMTNKYRGDDPKIALHSFSMSQPELMLSFLDFCKQSKARMPEVSWNEDNLSVNVDTVKFVLKEGSARIVSLFHSHPSGAVGASKEDRNGLAAVKWMQVTRGWVLSKTKGDDHIWTHGSLSSFTCAGEEARFTGRLR
jgi:proteasome lid subunit RPN8/RPN11